MTDILHNNKCDIFFPIDIDEFIVFYNKKKNLLRCDNIIKYMNVLLNKINFDFYKCDYINPLKTSGNDNIFKKFNKASLCDTYGDHRKTFICTKNITSNFKIDHGNHMSFIKNYFVSNISLVHYHFRSHKQKLKKSINNALGLNYDINIEKLENNNEEELLKLKNICKKGGKGIHHLNSLYKYYSGKIKTFERNINNNGKISLDPIKNFLNK